MALWQINFFITPKESLESYPFKNDEDLFDDTSFWEKRNVDKEFFTPISAFLPEGKSWSKDLIIFGHEVSNRIDVSLNPETRKVESASMRVDFTTPYAAIVQGVLNFCLINNLILLSNPQLEPVTLTVAGVRAVIEASPQIGTYNRLSGK